MSLSTYCQACGRQAPSKYVEFYQNIGALVMRFHKSLKGNLCRQCIDKYFWEYTLYTLFLGWWGMISLIVTPFLLVNNIVRYLFCLGMPPVPADAWQVGYDAIDGQGSTVPQARVMALNEEFQRVGCRAGQRCDSVF